MAMTTTVRQILDKAEQLEAQAAALRLAASVLNGGIHAQKQTAAARTIGQAIKLRQAQRQHDGDGDGDGHRPAAAAVKKPPASKWVAPSAALQARRRAKAVVVVGIVRDYGKPMPLAKLKEAAAAQGIDSLTGMFGYVRRGYLAKTGHRGQTRYSFRSMPEPPAPPA